MNTYNWLPTGQERYNYAGLRVLVTGASGNLGSAIACHMSSPGATLSLWGRDPSRLEATAGRCRARGAEAAVRILDLADFPAALAALDAEDDAAHFDCVMLVAGQGATQAGDAMVEDAMQVARQCHVNFTAPAAMAARIAARMGARGEGRIGLVGSAAAFHSLPFAPSYAGSKAGLARFADALRIAAQRHGVTITLAAPGFIASPPDTAACAARPGELHVERAAMAIVAAVMRGQAELVVPRRFAALRWLDRVLPRALRDRLLSALPAP